MPYPKGNRDEWISLTELETRISGPFSMIDICDDKETVLKNFNSLREYARKFITPA